MHRGGGHPNDLLLKPLIGRELGAHDEAVNVAFGDDGGVLLCHPMKGVLKRGLLCNGPPQLPGSPHTPAATPIPGDEPRLPIDHDGSDVRLLNHAQAGVQRRDASLGFQALGCEAFSTG